MKQEHLYIAAAVLVVIVIAIVLLGGADKDPLDAYITQRTCDFLVINDFRAFACEDGFLGTFNPLR